MRRWTDEEKRYLGEITPGHHYSEIMELMGARFGRKYSNKTIAGAVKRYGFRTGFTGEFKKGNIPFNKGMKGISFGGIKTRFKKGEPSLNKRPVGSQRISRDGYIEVKIAEPDKWDLKHRIVWEKVNGKVPDGYALLFLNGNKQDIRLENLQLVSRNELLVMNQRKLIYKNAEMTKTGVNIAKLNIKINDRRRNDNSRRQNKREAKA